LGKILGYATVSGVPSVRYFIVDFRGGADTHHTQTTQKHTDTRPLLNTTGSQPTTQQGKL
jgi:hypothetical protein